LQQPSITKGDDLNMKRDLDLIRLILLKIEDTDLTTTRLTCESFCDINGSELYTEAFISHHIELLLDSGYVKALRVDSMGRLYSDFIIKRITSAGYDYLDSVRDESVWKTVKNRLSSVGSSVALDIIQSLGAAVIKEKLGI
jgi:DNA-binding transcriptional ArsR family regulator